MFLVSVLAVVFAIVGWGIIILVALLMFSGSLISSQVFRSPQAVQLVVGALTPYFFLSLGPFLGWGILQGLVEMHKELEALRGQLRSGAIDQSNAGESRGRSVEDPLS